LEYWLAAKIYNVNDDTEVKVVVIFKGELESARGLLVHLALVAVLCKILNRLNLDLMTCSLKNPKQPVNGWVAKTTV
jgi:hypothetical protein